MIAYDMTRYDMIYMLCPLRGSTFFWLGTPHPKIAGPPVALLVFALSAESDTTGLGFQFWISGLGMYPRANSAERCFGGSWMYFSLALQLGRVLHGATLVFPYSLSPNC